ncbi:hypothetical protein ACQGRJ_18290 [Bacillus atrophaeus]|nr:hypothetical protein [Bacillus atrophaeus]
MTKIINVNQQHLLEQLAGGSVNRQCTIEALIDNSHRQKGVYLRRIC